MSKSKSTISGKPSLLKAMSDSVLAMTAAHRVEGVLQLLAESARDLAGARYAAIGIPDEEGGFAAFIHTGMADELVARIGPLPRRHGLLAAMLAEVEPYRTADIRKDPRFEWWPDAHPRMKSFLGVPVISHGAVIAAFYLTDKIDGDEFSSEDQGTIEMLAAHAAIAIENARLYERSRELTLTEERNRLAREMHDSVVQMLFSISLTAEALASLIESDPQTARAQAETLRDMSREATQEMRSLIFELRPADLAEDGLVSVLRKHVDVLQRTSRKEIDFRDEGYAAQSLQIERELYRIIQEAINNAVRHAGASQISVRLGVIGHAVEATIEDDGIGYNQNDPTIRTRRLGLTSMEERAEELGGEVNIKSHSGKGSRVQVRVPLAG
jgi:signal transduction histidine kinase